MGFARGYHSKHWAKRCMSGRHWLSRSRPRHSELTVEEIAIRRDRIDRSLSFRPCETKHNSQGKRMSPTANDHGEYEGQAALYAAGALSASDALAFETHAADCALCAQEFHSLQPVIRTLGSLAAKVPPPTASAAPSGPCQPRSSLDPGLAAVDGRSSSSSLLNPSG